LVITGYVYAGGDREDPFAEVDLLFSEKRYSEAMPLLTVILTDNPELFDEVEARGQKYLTVKREISDLEEGIIADIKSENPAGIFEKIGLIRDLEPFPDEFRALVLDDYLYEAAVIVNTGTINDIMDEALALLKDRQYWDAVALYSSGLEIGWEIFESSDFGNIAVDMALSSRTGIAEATQTFAALQESFLDAVDAKDDAFGGTSIAALSAAADALYSDLLSLIELRLSVESHDRTIQDTRSGLRESREDKRDVAYLRYLHSFTSGREEVSEDEGIVDALRSLWDETQAEFGDQAFAYIQQQYGSAQESFSGGQWGRAREEFDRVIAAAPVVTRAFTIPSAIISPSDGYALNDTDRSLVDTISDRILYSRGRERVAGEYIKAIPRLTQADDLQAISDSAPLGTLRVRRTEISRAVEALNDSSASIASEATYFENLAEAEIDVEEEIGLFAELELLVSDAKLASLDLDVSIAARMAESRIATLAGNFEPVAADVGTGTALVKGALTGSNGEILGPDATESERADAIVKRYPEKGRLVLLRARGSLDSLILDVNTLVEDLKVDEDYVLADTRMTDALAGGARLQSDVDQRSSEVDDLLRLAAEEIRLARLYKDQAYDFVEDAEESVKVDDFTSTRNFLTAASSAMLESISHQQDDVFADEIGSKIASLTGEINNQVVRIVVREVGDLIDSALQSYGAQEYIDAEGSLLQAQAKWATVYTDPDDVIEYWLATVQTALSVSTGREISDTDPTYREMRQYLNYALADFRDSQNLLERNDRVGALNKLDDVQESLRVVLQRYPYNEEANLLNWQITKIEDSDKYYRDIREQITSARTALSTPAAGDAYIALQAIQRLEPDYPGLDELIYEAEIALGLRTPPQTVEETNVALELFTEARDLYETGNPERRAEALEKLSQALLIDPGYADARDLRNTINSERGGNVATALSSSEDMQFFLKAVNLFTENRPGDALRIVIRLWDNEDNRNYQSLIDLRAKVYGATGASL
jgi:hypothetical protein